MSGSVLTLAAVLALGCRSEVPAPLPPPVRQGPSAVGRQVRMGEVEGWIARPVSSETAPGAPPHSGELWLVEVLDESERADAVTRAEQGVVVLVVAPPVDGTAALAYLSGMPDVSTVSLRCLRTSCD